MKTTSRRIRLFRIRRTDVLRALFDSKTRLAFMGNCALPDDARVLEVHENPMWGSLDFYVEGSTYPLVAEGDPIEPETIVVQEIAPQSDLRRAAALIANAHNVLSRSIAFEACDMAKGPLGPLG